MRQEGGVLANSDIDKAKLGSLELDVYDCILGVGRYIVQETTSETIRIPSAWSESLE